MDGQPCVIAKYDYVSQGPQELTIKKSEKLILLDDSKHWWKVINADKVTGFVPSNYVKKERQSLLDSFKKGIRVNTKKKSNSNFETSPLSPPLIEQNLMDTNLPTSPNHLPFTIQPSNNGRTQETSNSELLAKELGPHFNSFNVNDTSSKPDDNFSNNNNNHNSDSVTTNGQPKTLALVKYNYKSQQADELSLTKGANVVVIEKSSDGWWKGELCGKVGWFPSNYVTETQASSSCQDSNPTIQNQTSKKDSNANSVPDQQNSTGHKGSHVSDNLLINNNLFTNDNKVLSTTCSQKAVLYVVVALYSFQSQNDEELSFEKDEYLDIIEKPINDPDWWRACNQNGEVGLVPRNYVQLVPEMNSIRNWSDKSPTRRPSNTNRQHPIESSKNSNLDTSDFKKLKDPQTSKEVSKLADEINSLNLMDNIWYHGQMGRNLCDQLLNAYAEDGDFVIRNSETNAGDFSVSLKAPIRNKHFRVNYVDRLFFIGQRKFKTLDDLIEHYKKTPIYTSPTGEKMFLKKPYPREVM